MTMRNEMLLSIDIGNTTIAFGVFQGGKLKSTWKISTHNIFSKKPIRLPKNIDAAIISSVVPKVTPIIKKAIAKKYKIRPLVLGENIRAPIKNLYRNPKQVGQDRLVNAVAAKKLYGSPAIVIDFGTAITFDIINKRGEYAGGVIIPGIETSLGALSSKAALLPKLKLAPPEELVGLDTVNSMRSGICYGFGALCDGLVAKLKAEYGPMKVIATGGHCNLMSKFSKSIDETNPHLTLYGLQTIYDNPTYSW
jgi:type III pantothenate kinase